MIALNSILTLGEILPEHDIPQWKLDCFFFGSIIFLLGYAISVIACPPDIARSKTLEKGLTDFGKLHTRQVFEDRLKILRAIVDSYSKKLPPDLQPGILDAANNVIASAEKNLQEEDEIKDVADLYSFDLLLQMYDKYLLRVTTVALFGLGGGLIFLPFLVSVANVLCAKFGGMV